MSDVLLASGASAPAMTGPEITEQARGGSEYTLKWVGTKTEIETQRAIVRVSGGYSSLRMVPSGDGSWELSATFAGLPDGDGGVDADPPTNLHELEISAEIVPVWQAPKMSTAFTATALRLMSEVAKLYDDGEYRASTSDYMTEVGLAWTTSAQATALADISRKFTAASISSETAAAQEFFDDVIFKGGDKAYNYNPVYRRTITSASYAQVKASYVGMGQIWTSAEVSSFEGVPNGEWFAIPSIDTYWLKLPPRVSAAASGKTSIEYGYQGGFKTASKYQYTAYGSATLT